jgi:hypothetical protein
LLLHLSGAATLLGLQSLPPLSRLWMNACS